MPGMPNPIPVCFRGCATVRPPAPPPAQPTLTTSTYETHLGLAALTWSRTLLGLSLRFHLRLSPAHPGGADTPSPASPFADDDEPLRFHVRPWLIWKRRGSQRFHLRRRCIDVSWDLSRALFPAASPEPSSGFYVSVSVDGETVLVAGDAAHKLAPRPAAAALVSRRDHVVLAAAGARTYETTARFGGREREISIELSGGGAAKEVAGMAVAVDGRRVLHVRRLRWKFRGSERVEVEGGGGRVHLSWDLHSWLFPSPPLNDDDAGGGGGVFAFRFEAEAAGEEGRLGKEVRRRVVFDGGYFGKSRNWSDSSSGGGGRKGRLVKTSSFSSTSSVASTGSGSTVMDWDSPEEAELRRMEGFTLLVHVWKS